MAIDTRNMQDKPQFDIIKSVEELQEMYNNSVSANYLRNVLFGDIGVGKTSILLTAPRPIHHDSFDRGGSVSIRRGIMEKWIISDTRWEDENPRNPTIIEKFEKVLDERLASGYFNYFSTYCLDGLTMLQAAGMNIVLRDRRRSDWIPATGKGKDNDYVAMQAKIEPILRKVLNIPCHIILTAHLDMLSDEVNEDKKYVGPKVSGGLQARLMSIVDEVWCLKLKTVPISSDPAKGTPSGLKREIMTQPDGIYRCRSRLAALGNIKTFEEPDFKALLRKGGYSDADKSIPWLEK